MLDRSRSAVWPLVLALAVGVTLGFAGGYAVAVRSQPATVADTTASAAPATPLREFTEAAVPAAPKPAAPPAAAATTSKPEIVSRPVEPPPENVTTRACHSRSGAGRGAPAESAGRIAEGRCGAGCHANTADLDGRAPECPIDAARRDGIGRRPRRWRNADGRARSQGRAASHPDQARWLCRPRSPRRDHACSVPVQMVNATLTRQAPPAGRGAPTTARSPAAPPAPAAATGSGTLTVESRPAGANVLLDGKSHRDNAAHDAIGACRPPRDSPGTRRLSHLGRLRARRGERAGAREGVVGAMKSLFLTLVRSPS